MWGPHRFESVTLAFKAVITTSSAVTEPFVSTAKAKQKAAARTFRFHLGGMRYEPATAGQSATRHLHKGEIIRSKTMRRKRERAESRGGGRERRRDSS